MTLQETIKRMQEVVEEAKSELEGYGFNISVETDFMNSSLQTLPDSKRAKYVTVSLVIGADGIEAGDEYCMSLGADISKKGINTEQLEKDIVNYKNMVAEAKEALAGYENKTEGLAHLTKKAGEEYEKLLKKIEEQQAKNRKMSMIINSVFIVGLIILFFVAMLTK